jgi:maleate cis-trans isomerase
MTRPDQPRRLGFLVPAQNVMVETDAMALCPPGATVHFARPDVPQDRPIYAQFDAMLEDAPCAARILAKAGVAAIGFACTSGSFYRGPGSDETIAAELREAAGVPCVTTATAVLWALRALKATRVAVATPYIDTIVAAERAFLEAAGFAVTAISGMGIERGRDIHAVPLADTVAAAEAIDSVEAEAVFISCTDLAAVPAIAELEDRLGKPVVTSNQATVWACAGLAGANRPDGHGRLNTLALEAEA